MPRPPVPPEVDELLARPNPAVIASVRPDGGPHTAPTWYIWEGGRVLVNMADSRARLGYLRRDPRVALSVLNEGSWYRHVSLLGRVESIEPDPDMSDIDRLARHYTGGPHRNRDQPRWSAWIAVERWHGWEGGRPWPPGAD